MVKSKCVVYRDLIRPSCDPWVCGQAVSASLGSPVVISFAGSVLVVARVMRDRVDDVEAEVAAAFGPFVVLFGQDRADEADEGVAVGEDPDDVGAAADLLVQPLLGVVGPDLPPDLLRERGERGQMSGGLRPGGRRPSGASRPAPPGPGRTGRRRLSRRVGRRSSAASSAPTATTSSGCGPSGSPRSGCGSAATTRRAGSRRSRRPGLRGRRR